MRTVLVDVDTQRDFCDADGALAVPGADLISTRSAQGALVAHARRAGWTRIATADDHDLVDDEIALPGLREPDFRTLFPPHCLRGTRGAERITETRLESPLVLSDRRHETALLEHLLDDQRQEILIHKREFSAFSNPNLDAVLNILAPERVVVFGVATDICVAAMIDGLLERDTPEIVVCIDACAGLDDNRIGELLQTWQDEGVEITSVDRLAAALVE